MSVQVRPATADRWRDLVGAFGRRGEDPSWCWCQLFVRQADQPTSASEPAQDNRDALRREIAQAAVPPGLISYVGDQPVGWTRVGPRSDFSGVSGNRALAMLIPEAQEAWGFTCFVVNSRKR